MGLFLLVFGMCTIHLAPEYSRILTSNRRLSHGKSACIVLSMPISVPWCIEHSYRLCMLNWVFANPSIATICQAAFQNPIEAVFAGVAHQKPVSPDANDKFCPFPTPTEIFEKTSRRSLIQSFFHVFFLDVRCLFPNDTVFNATQMDTFPPNHTTGV